MAYSKKNRSRSSSYRGRGSRRTARKAVARAYRRPKYKAPARKRYRKTVKPQAIRIEIVQSAGSDLSPLQMQMQEKRSETLPKKAKF